MPLAAQGLHLGTPKGHKHKCYRDIPTLLGFIIRGFIWDIPILIFAYVLFWGPIHGFGVSDVFGSDIQRTLRNPKALNPKPETTSPKS